MAYDRQFSAHDDPLHSDRRCGADYGEKAAQGELSSHRAGHHHLISNIATLPIEDTNIPLTAGLVSIFTLVACEVLVSVFF